MAPLVIRDHVLVGSGDVTDIPGFLESIDPATGKLQWRWYSEPKLGEPGSETWPKGTDAITHGGGMTWITGTYDPQLNAYVYGARGKSTASAGMETHTAGRQSVHVLDSGASIQIRQVEVGISSRRARYHDWDAAQTPILFEDMKKRSQAEADRAGQQERIFFVRIDRRASIF